MIKNALISAAIFCLLQLSTACQSVPSEGKPLPTALSGKFERPSRNFFTVERPGAVDTIKVKDDGTFTQNITLTQPTQLRVVMAKNSANIYMLPGEELNITYTTTTLLDGVKYSGKSAAYCTYLTDRQKEDRTLRNNIPYHTWATREPESFLQQRDSIRTARMIVLEKAAKNSGFSAGFLDSEKKSFDYQLANDVILYRQAVAERIANLPNALLNIIYNTPRDVEQMVADEYYMEFAQNLVKQESAIAYNTGEDKSYLHYFDLQVNKTCELFTNAACRNAIYARVMQDVMKEVGTQDLTALLHTFQNCCTDQKLVQRIKLYAAQYEHMYAGRKAPDAACYDLAGKPMRFSDFKGQLLYVDVWATWCGPCKREIPDLKKLESEYKGKKVQFVSVSTDKDVEAWKNYIQKNEMAGLQLHQTDNMAESVSMLYMVNSIPRFLLIDAEGNIISADAPRPSSGKEIRNLLNQHLKN